MLHKVTRRTLALALCGWLIAADAGALTVGRARGAVLVGRPLDLAIPVTLEGTDEPCASAEVFYGEERLRREPTVRWEPGAAGQGVLRVLSAVPVDEPMVTVYLRVGCGQSTTRRFVMLSELPPEIEPVAPRIAPMPAQPQVAGRPAVQSQPASRPESASAAPGSSAVPGASAATVPAAGPRRRDPSPVDSAISALRPARELPAARVQPGRPTAPAPETRARRTEPSANGRPRLKLEAIDLGPDRDPVLRLSSELRSEVATDPERRAAAAALWRALQKTPDEFLQEALRLQTVERELRSLRDVTQQNAANVARMREEVERARGERGLAAGVVAALAALLLALLGWFGWRWYAERRLQNVGRWFEENGEGRAGAALAHPAGGLQTQPAPFLRAGSPAPGAFAAGAGAAAGAAAAADGASPARSVPTPLGSITPAFPRDEFQSSRGTIMRTVGVQELIDVHDKADFFLSIGEYDQAIALLEAHIYDEVETSPLAWMDLLELFHSLGRRGDYERLRNEFRQRFNGQLPDFDHFDQPSATLEHFDRALSRIMELWPSPRVLELIEESIFRKPGLPGTEPFSLEAYRELVLLYHVAHELAAEPADAEAGTGTVTGSFDDTAAVPALNPPLNPPQRADAVVAPRELLMVPPASARLGVDIDLGELPERPSPPLASPPLASPARDTIAWPGAQPENESRDLPALDFDLDEPTGTASLDAPRKGS